ncbi:probable inactive receptor kinase At5g58300 [Mangifera indica]|uniref:probable inactive receptor kinase At5g58300 n=1 Tax=Mangifera indica TaxID=29780 RepID=UPI001CFB1119|nr:probable inactive receptor kinase At5g58300 [Mangifera indica]
MKFHKSIAVLAFLFFVLCIVPPIITDLNSDRQALLQFVAAVPHARKLNWNATTSVCSSWFGITCNVNGTQVVGIHLPGVGLTGPLPANSLEKLNGLQVLSLRSNYLSGNLPSGITSIPSLQYLYLQHNSFSGAFPETISPQLMVLDLSFNSFTEKIPQIIKNLTRLNVLNLQKNSISGAIPPLKLPRLKTLNLSYNNLIGSIPSSLQKFPDSSFVGNSLLCGLPLKSCSSISSSPAPSPVYFPTPTTITPHQHALSSKKLSSGSIIAIVIGGCAVLFLLLAMFFVCCLKKRDSEDGGVLKGKVSSSRNGEKPKEFGSGVQEAEKNKLCFFEGCPYNFDLEDLLRASAEVLGKGSYGSTYKAILEDGTAVVVKRLKEVGASKKEFEQQMELIGRIGQHSNVVPVRAYYYSKDEKLLVFNYMPSGSLFLLLHGSRIEGGSPLDWNSRVKIALGTARGLAHIHNYSENNGSVKFIHGNIKSSNVLLTQDLDGCISDVGLAPLMNYSPATKPRKIGYRAPEVIETRKVSQKSDVYSFGVLLLEMLTGKAPLQHSGHEDVVDLPRWVRSVVREEWTAEVFDVELVRYQNVEEEMVQMLQIGLSCVAKVPEMRPKMDEVVRMMEEIQQPALKNRTSSEAESNVQTP